MTANEQRNLFKELYDGASAQEMGFDDIEVSRFFNLAQDLVLNELFFSNRNRLQEGFELSSKRDVQLNNLKRSITLWKNITTGHWEYTTYDNIVLEADVNIIFDKDYIQSYNSVIIESIEDMLYILKDNVDIKTDNGELIRNIKVKNINEDNINDILTSPFNKPNKRIIYRTSEMKYYNRSVTHRNLSRLYMKENYNFNRWNLTYIKRPIEIMVDILNPTNQVNCELDPMFHNDIVFKAVQLALGSIGSQKFQIADYEQKTNIN